MLRPPSRSTKTLRPGHLLRVLRLLQSLELQVPNWLELVARTGSFVLFVFNLNFPHFGTVSFWFQPKGCPPDILRLRTFAIVVHPCCDKLESLLGCHREETNGPVTAVTHLPVLSSPTFITIRKGDTKRKGYYQKTCVFIFSFSN